MKKTPELTNIATNIYHDKRLSKQNVSPFFEMLLFYNKEKSPFLFESDLFCYGCWLPLFSK